MDSKIVAYVQNSDAIPAMPQIVTRLTELTGDENYNIRDVINLLSADAAIATDVLRLANSPIFGVTRKIASLTHAVNLLGIQRIRSLVTGRCMVDRMSSAPAGPIDLSYYWRRSLATAVLAARFAEHVAPSLREESFMSGLLSDVGVVILARAIPKEYGEVAKRYAPKGSADYSECEFKAIGVTHASISAMALERWALPKLMVEAVKHHHDPTIGETETGDDSAKIAVLLRGASELAKILSEAPDEETLANSCEQAMQFVGLNLEVFEHLLPKVEGDIADFAESLRIDVIPSRIYGLIADAIAKRLATPTV
jgi:HD-like signal output (HDOD) protein